MKAEERKRKGKGKQGNRKTEKKNEWDWVKENGKFVR